MAKASIFNTTLARAALAASLVAVLSGCALTKVVTVPVKVVAGTVETAADVVD
ncbi:DUF6726 family protein [Pedomonas mirosovicensis]|uniref:DUF6726 family protein n=1 Tax=Pedomonas mirosovicensis TaxID=2908641 RepID=UPI00216855A5|nr:DUF6726 family protein [Pedomonas mirosovicensis]MCH8683949.1 hypothetical protein [Pedomonas mirosovicensis]